MRRTHIYTTMSALAEDEKFRELLIAHIRQQPKKVRLKLRFVGWAWTGSDSQTKAQMEAQEGVPKI